MSSNSVNSNRSPRVIKVRDTLDKSRYRNELSGQGIAGGRVDSRLELTHRDFLDLSLDDSSTFTYYQVKDLDRLDHLAFEWLGDSRLWWVLMDLNSEVLTDSVILPTGTYIKLPNLNVLSDALGR
jgi:hypothetical protein